jgi:hypothetical protein
MPAQTFQEPDVNLDYVTAVNYGPLPFIDACNGRIFRIEPGAQFTIPFDALCLWMGHPRANNFDPRNPVRHQIFEQLRARYGAYDDKERGVSAEQLWEQNKPTLEIYDQYGKRVITVVDDPEGNMVSDEGTTSAMSTEQDMIMAEFTKMRREIEELRSALNRQQDDASPIPPPSTPEIRTDSPASTIVPPPDPTARQAPKPPPRVEVSEDAPTQVRVT